MSAPRLTAQQGHYLLYTIAVILVFLFFMLGTWARFVFQKFPALPVGTPISWSEYYDQGGCDPGYIGEDQDDYVVCVKEVQ